MKKIKPDGSKTIYVGGIYEVDETSGGTVTRTVTYYPAGGAMRIVDSTGNNLYYVLKDHLGSASVVTDNTVNADIVSEQRYYPYGETRLTATMLTDKLFTGQREMAGLGIYHFNARFYSPKLGRFLSPDTIVPGYANPQSWNRFSYVANNPLRYTDPTGHRCAPEDDCQGGENVHTYLREPSYWKVRIKREFGITMSDDGGKSWDLRNLTLVSSSLRNIDASLNGNLKSFVGGATFTLSEHHPDADHPNSTYHGWTDGTNVTFFTTGSQVIRQMNIYHEFGHVLNSLPGRDNVFSNHLDRLDSPSFIENNYVNRDALTNSADVFVQASSNAVTEQWADVFANYVAGNIDLDTSEGQDMYNFVTKTLIQNIPIDIR